MTAFRDSKSLAAERRVFEMLQRIDLGPHWKAYHSLNCSDHEYKHWAEIDFALVGPEAIIVLEVKGGRVRRKAGVWEYTDRNDRVHRSTEGPFNQARSAMYALRNLLSERYKLDAIANQRLTFGFGVVFPSIDWEHDTVETPREIVADRLVVAEDRYFLRYLRGRIQYWTSKSSSRSELALIGQKQ